MSNLLQPASSAEIEWSFDLDPERADEGASPVSGGGSDWKQRALEYLELSTVLRVFGAGVMVTAIGVFLFQHWEAGNDLSRYSMLLGQTLLLCLLGFGTNRLLREPKSARVFLALGLVSTAACFTVLGALLYSTLQWDVVNTNYPGFAYWQVESTAVAITWTLGSMVVLAPVTVLGFMVLARPAAIRLSWLFLANAALLLLPVRDPAVAAAVAAAAAMLTFVVLGRTRNVIPAVRTAEGRIARLIVVLPIAIIAVRCGYLYAASPVSVGCLSLLAYLTLRQLTVSAPAMLALRRTLEILSLGPALLTAFATAEFVDRLVTSRYDDELAIATFALVLGAGLVDLAQRSQRDGLLYIRLAALVALLTGILEVAVEPSMTTAMVCALLSALVAVYTRGAGLVVLYRLSLLTMLGALAYHVYFAINAFDFGGWLGLAILGMVAIAGAAAVERHGERIKYMMLKTFSATR